MRLSTSTNILFARPGNRSVDLKETLKMAGEAGFDTFDLCFYDWVLPGSPFLTEGWKGWAFSIREEANRLGVRFGQCHAHFYNFLSRELSEEKKAREQELVLRSLECCAILGSKVCVTHPETWPDDICYREKSREANYEYFSNLLEQTERLSVTLALENMCDYSIAPKRKYTSAPEELVELVDRFQDPRIGVCWDFEHAEIMEQDQRQALLYIGKRLKATHVSDTHSKTDPSLMHVMPFFGDIDWECIMKTLKEIGYQGDFSFEAHNFANRLPDQVLPEALRLSYRIGRYLMELGGECSCALK